MVIFTYKDYIKQKEYDKALFGLWNTIQKNKNQEVYKSNLCVSVMEDKEEYILCSGEDIEEENKEKITKNKVNHEHDKIFRSFVDFISLKIFFWKPLKLVPPIFINFTLSLSLKNGAPSLFSFVIKTTSYPLSARDEDRKHKTFSVPPALLITSVLW